MHAQIATGLASRGWHQERIAELLGSTQSSVSRWITRPQPTLATAEDEQVVQNAAEKIVANLLKHGAPSESMTFSIKASDIEGEIWSVDFALRTATSASASSRARLLSSLNRLLSQLPPIPNHLQPGVGINIAACATAAESSQDVAAFPGRLILNGDSVIQQPPQFGVSRHLSSLLLDQREKGSSATTIVNLHPPALDLINSFVKSSGLTMTTAPRGIAPMSADILLDEGDFGWEPNIYITASDISTLRARLSAFIEHCKR